MLPDWKRIVPESLYSVMAARKLLGISHTTIYEYMKLSPRVLPYHRSENGRHRLILGSDIIRLRDHPQVKRGRRHKDR